MTTFKLLCTLLSVVVLGNAQGTHPPLPGALSAHAGSKCNATACIKDISAIPGAASSCIAAGQAIGELTPIYPPGGGEEDDDDDDAPPPPPPANHTDIGKAVLDCVTTLISASLDLPADCGPCLNQIQDDSPPPSASAPAPAPGATKA